MFLKLNVWTKNVWNKWQNFQFFPIIYPFYFWLEFRPTALQIGKLIQQNWSQITQRKPTEHTVCFDHTVGTTLSCHKLPITECDRRSLNPTQTLFVAWAYVVGLFQNAMFWKSVIDISSTHQVTLLISIGNMTSNVLISADGAEERAGLFKREGRSGDLLCNSEDFFSLHYKCIPPRRKPQSRHTNAQQNTLH